MDFDICKYMDNIHINIILLSFGRRGGAGEVMYHIIITAPWRADELKASNLPKIFNFFLQKDLLNCTFPLFFVN